MKHYVIISSSYSSGTRIALDITIEGKSDKQKVIDVSKQILDSCGKDTPIATHLIDTTSSSWKSVIEADSFFKDIKLISDVSEFIALILKDKTLDSVSVAKYILTQVKCSHLKLEKLVYLCYAEYLCQTNARLFDDEIYAFKYGPVVKDVYEHYKVYERREIETRLSDEFTLQLRSRISFSSNGLDKLYCIDDTIKRCKDLTATQLIDITHSDGSPWKSVYDGTYRKIIPDELIKERHCVEKA